MWNYNARYYHLAKISAEIAGYPIQPLWIYAQWMHETANFTSDLATSYYNFGGVTQTTPNELPQPDGNLYYRKFSCPEEFAEYFGRYLRLYEEDGIRFSYNMSTYATALKRGGYFGDSIENYVEGMISYVTS